MEDFETFWKAYPRKTAKGDARKAWLTVEKIRPPLAELLASIEAHKQTDQWLRDNGEYIPYPATYLRQERWEDELQIDLGPNKNGKAWHETWTGTVAKGSEFGLSPSQFAHPSEFVAAVMRKANQKLERVA